MLLILIIAVLGLFFFYRYQSEKMTELESSIPFYLLRDPLTNAESSKDTEELKTYLKRNYNDVKKSQKPRMSLYRGQFMKSIDGQPPLPFPCKVPGVNYGLNEWGAGNGPNYGVVATVDDVIKIINDGNVIPKEWYNTCPGLDSRQSPIGGYGNATAYYSSNPEKFKIKSVMLERQGNGSYQVFITNDVRPEYKNQPKVEFNKDTKVEGPWQTIVIEDN